MRINFARPALFLAAATMVFNLAAAQSGDGAHTKNASENSADQSVTTMSVQVKVVNVLATVRDKHGKIINNLTKDDFTLSEDGRPQTIRYFSRETDIPLTLGLLVDTSMSQRRVLGEERSASQSFLTQMLREDKDKAFVIHFDREVELLQDLTSSHEKLRVSLESLDTPQFSRTSGGGYPGGGGGGAERGYPGGGGSGGGSGRHHGGGTLLYDSRLPGF